METNELALRKLVKEGEHNIRTYTKTGSKEKVGVEYKGALFLKKLGFRTPEIINYTGTVLTTKFVDGISAFRALEILSQQKNNQEIIYTIIDELCQGIETFQRSRKELKLNFAAYKVEEKVADIARMLEEFNCCLAQNILNVLPKIIHFYKNAKIPFRDANPKNYIFQGINEANIETLKDQYKERLFYFDYSTFNTLTFRSDDFASVLFHYMIDDDLRKDLCKKYNIDLSNEENVVCCFVRFGRFWVRRQYYKRYRPRLFKKRYKYENLKFYDNLMNEYAQKAILELSNE